MELNPWLSTGSSSWTRTNDPAVNSRMLYRLSYGGIFQAPALLSQDLCWRYLSSRAVASQVLWAETSLTTVFGMGTGGPSPLKTLTAASEFLETPYASSVLVCLTLSLLVHLQGFEPGTH